MEEIVYDAETGEPLTIAVHPPKKSKYESVGMYSPHSIHKKLVTRNSNAITQSTRRLGDQVGWNAKNVEKQKKLEQQFKDSLAGKKYQLAFDKSMTAEETQQLQFKILDMIKEDYQYQKTKVIQKEMQREIQRQVDMQLENSTIGRRRLAEQHDAEREYYQTQIDRITEECELSLAARMVKLNLLR